MSADMLWDDDYARARLTDDLTSHAAADSNDAAVRSAVERIILDRLSVRPSTDTELSEYYFHFAARQGWPLVHQDSVRKRRSDLTRKGFVVATNVTRLTPSGRAARVFAKSGLVAV